MIVKLLSNADCTLIHRICSDKWSIQKCHNRLRALEVISSLPDEAVYCRFTLEMVCRAITFLNSWDQDAQYSSQRHLLQLSRFARSFGEILTLGNLELSMYQDAVTRASSFDILKAMIPDSVAYLAEMMTEEQHAWEGFDRWYCTMMDYAVFGSKTNLIELDK